ncbi:MAG: hypothetical protein KF866_01110 [Phycisphaeraceae bacterium]|nr:hypothetical protein [Phycisphaeraceae bacterium]MCW5755061.1 hypothetical protein [Phycisphaeraceae bacterium]
MSLTPSQADALLIALDALAKGLPRRFEDVLWLHFGDHWTEYRRFLAAKGHAKLGTLGTGDGEITDKGRELLNRLRAMRAAQAGVPAMA